MPGIVGLIPYPAGAGVLPVMVAVRGVCALCDRRALIAAREYGEASGLECIGAKAFPDHCGLSFRKNGKRFHTGSDFERNRTITWKKGAPPGIAA